MKYKEDIMNHKRNEEIAHHASFETGIVIENIARQLGKVKGNVLDFGCGKSLFSQIFINEDSSYFGLDVNYQILKLQTDEDLKDNISNKFFINASGTPFRTETFSYIFCFHVLEHLYKPDIQKIVRDFHRILKPNGIFVVGVPIMGQVGKIAFRIRTLVRQVDPKKHIDHTRDENHRCVFSIEDIISICNNSGFSELKNKRLSNFRILNIFSRFFNLENKFLAHFILRSNPIFDVLAFFRKEEILQSTGTSISAQ